MRRPWDRWPRTRLARLLAAGFLVATLVPLAGCDRDGGACGPEVPAGRILGHVRTGGLSVTATVAAYRVAAGATTAGPFETRTDTTGYYGLDLPVGRYVVRVSVPGSYAWSAGTLYGTLTGAVSATPDTLLIDGSRFATTLDFDLAGLDFDLALSHALDGEQGRIVLHRRAGEPATVAEATAIARGEIADGRLRLSVPGLPPGDYQVEVVLGYRDYLCNCTYDGEHLWLPGTRDRSASPWTTLAPDARVTLHGQVAAEPAWLLGSVGGAARAMGLLGSVDIVVVTPDSLTVLGRRRLLRGDGVIAVPLHLAGRVKVAAVQDGVTFWAGGPGFAAATSFDLVPGREVAGVDIATSGLLVDVDGPGADLAAAALEFHDADSGAVVTTAFKLIGAQRRFGVANLGPGRYVLQVRHAHGFVDDVLAVPAVGPLWRPQWFDRAADFASAPVLDVGAGQVVPIQLHLEPGGMITGRVDAVADAAWCYVFATPADRRETLDQVFVSLSPDRNTFAITGLADGEYKLGVCAGALVADGISPPPAATVWYPGTDDWAAAATFGIANAGAVVDVVLPPPWAGVVIVCPHSGQAS